MIQLLLLQLLLEFLWLLLGKGYESADDWAHSLLQDLYCLMLILFLDPLGEIMDEHVHDDLMKRLERHQIK
jgi:hypothetical protein